MKKVEEMRESPRGKSMLSEFQSCERLWAWRRIRGFRPTRTEDYFITGGIVHEAQEVFYGGQWNSLNDAWEATMRRAHELIAQIPEDDRDRLGNIIKRFLKVWYTEIGTKDLETLRVVAVEEEQTIQLYNGFEMTVRLDRAFYDKETREIFIDDTKTTGWSLEGTLRNYMYNDQPKLYVLSFLDDPLFDQIAGWRTTCLYVNGKVERAQRSGIVMPTLEELEDVKRSYTVLTDDIASKLHEHYDNGTPITACFSRNGSNCLNKYGRTCPHIEHCHKIDDMDYHPEGFELDPWLAEGVIQDAFKEL